MAYDVCFILTRGDSEIETIDGYDKSKVLIQGKAKVQFTNASGTCLVILSERTACELVNTFDGARVILGLNFSPGSQILRQAGEHLLTSEELEIVHRQDAVHLNSEDEQDELVQENQVEGESQGEDRE